MSPSVGNFVHDLVEMAKAMETLPIVQDELRRTENTNRELLDRIQSLELRLMDRASEIDALHAKIREAEQARDQAETMFLEETDRTASFKSFVENLFGTAGNLLKAASPPTPVAVPEVEQIQPEARADEVTPQTERHDMFPEPEYYTSIASPQGESAADPTASSTEAAPMSVPSHGAEEQALVSGPYSGKWYSDHPAYVSLPDWLAGGGTEETYFGNKHAPRFG